MRSFRGYSAISVWFKRSRDVFTGYCVVYAREFRAKAMQSPCAGVANSLTIVTVSIIANRVASNLLETLTNDFAVNKTHQLVANLNGNNKPLISKVVS